MPFSYSLSRLCGAVHSGGNVTFGPDGNTLYSIVGNRVTVFDLVGHRCFTMPYEHTCGIRRLAVSPDSRFLLTVDESGYLLLGHLERRIVLCRMRLKRTRRVRDLQFSPDGKHFAVTQERQFQVWRTPGAVREFAPFALHRTYGSHADDITSLSWSADGAYLATTSKDATVRVWSLDPTPGFVPCTLSGHRDRVVGAFFSGDGSRLYSLARDGFMLTWERDEKGVWACKDRQSFKRDRHATLSSAQFHNRSNLLVVGFSNGVFGLYELPACSVIHTLSVSHGGIGTIAINRTGEWLALGCGALGQLLVWEWQSETYVLKQQGHADNVAALAFSGDGQIIATGGDDAKVKLWSASTGFAFVTFTPHTAPITAVTFLNSGQAVLSASLDGTVRAHDLIRYRNFRTLTTPTATQLVSLAVDPSGELVCAGSTEPFEVYVWALQTGKLLDVFAGHGGPVAALDFCPTLPMVASGAWDGTVKMWNVFKKELIETHSHTSDVLAVAFRPDGKELCVSTLSGQLHFWDVAEGNLLKVIEGRRDIRGGRGAEDRVTAANSAASKHFTSVTYTPDGTCVLAGGRSKYVCIYHVESAMLVKKFQLSHDRTLDGVLDKLNSSRLLDGGPIAGADLDDSEGEEPWAEGRLPGAKRADDGSRSSRAEVRSSCVRFSPTGREWAAATPQGLLVYGLEEDMVFDPVGLDEEATPEAVRACSQGGDHSKAIAMAAQLNEEPLLAEVLSAVPYDSLALVARSVHSSHAPRLLSLLAKRLPASPHLAYMLRWSLELLQAHGETLRKDPARHGAALRALQRAISRLHEDLGRFADQSQATLDLLASTALPSKEVGEGEEEGMEVE